MLLKSVDKILGALFSLFLGALLIGMIYNGLKELSPQTLKKLNAKEGKVVQFVYDFDTKFINGMPKFLQKKLKKMSPKKIEKRLDEKVEEME